MNQDKTDDAEEVKAGGLSESSLADYGKLQSSQHTTIHQPLKRKSKNKFIILALLLLALVVAGVIFRHQIKGLISGSINVQPTPSPTPTSEPLPTPSPLIKSDWSFEILNGSGVTGEAKKIADQIKDLGYIVVKTGNADKSDYSKTEILVKKEVLDKIDLVIADLKDIIKVASYGGELNDSTASARIIIGKDSI